LTLIYFAQKAGYSETANLGQIRIPFCRVLWTPQVTALAPVRTRLFPI